MTITCYICGREFKRVFSGDVACVMCSLDDLTGALYERAVAHAVSSHMCYNCLAVSSVPFPLPNGVHRLCERCAGELEEETKP